jgi:hypothetical protein
MNPLGMIKPASNPQKACNYWEMTDLLSGVAIIEEQRGALLPIEFSLQIVVVIWYREDQ